MVFQTDWRRHGSDGSDESFPRPLGGLAGDDESDGDKGTSPRVIDGLNVDESSVKERRGDFLRANPTSLMVTTLARVDVDAEGGPSFPDGMDGGEGGARTI